MDSIVSGKKYDFESELGTVSSEGAVIVSLSELREMGNLIIADMDAFRLESESSDFSMSVAEIKKTIKGFCTRFKDLKNLQIEKYNASVDLTNKKIKLLNK